MAKKFTLVVVLLTVLALCLTLAACGDSGKTTTEGTTATTTPTTGSDTTPTTGSDTTPTTGSDTTPTTGSDTTPATGSDTTLVTGSDTTPADTLPPVEAEIWAMIYEEDTQYMTRHLEYTYKERECLDGQTHVVFYFSIKSEGGQFPTQPVSSENPEIDGTYAISHTTPVAVYIKNVTTDENNVTKDADYTKYEITYWETSRWHEMYAEVEGFEPVDGDQYDIFMFCMSGSEETGANFPNTLHFLWDYGEPWTYVAPPAPPTSDNLSEEQLTQIKGDRTWLMPNNSNPEITINADGSVDYRFKSDNQPFGQTSVDTEEGKVDTYGVQYTEFGTLYIDGKEYEIEGYTPEKWYIVKFQIKDFTPVAGETYEILFTLNSTDQTGVYCKNSVGYYVLINNFVFNG